MSKTSPEPLIQVILETTADDPDSAELAQSAALVLRELQARGLKATMASLGPSAGSETIVSITIGNRGLQNGAVEFITREPNGLKSIKQNILLEDAVDRAWEFVNETRRRE